MWKFFSFNYVYLFVIVVGLIEFQIWMSKGNSNLSVERRSNIWLPDMWICPTDRDTTVIIESCILEHTGSVQECRTKGDVGYTHIGGNMDYMCANIGGRGSDDLIVRHNLDKLVLQVRQVPEDGKGTRTGSQGVVVVVGRNYLFGNQWFFAPTKSLTSVRLDRTERYEYTSPINSEVYHDYDMVVSSVPFGVQLRGDENAWPPSATLGQRLDDIIVAQDEQKNGGKLLSLQIQFKSMLITVIKVSYKYPPIADFARIFGPIGALIGLYKAYLDCKRRQKSRTHHHHNHRSRMRSGSGPV
eukprot:g4433.t1